jgi:glycosyltransferase involved in cell wall biosynthesis
LEMVRSEPDKSFSRTSVTAADEQARDHTSESFGTRTVDQTDQAARAMRDSDTAIRFQQLSEARRQAEAQLSAILLSRSWRWTRPLRWIKTQWCELLLREPIGRESGLVQSGRHDRLRGQSAAAIRPASTETGFRETFETIVVMAHEASRTGAPILAWNLVKKLQHRYNVVVLFRAEGGLFSVFEEAAAAVVSLPQEMESTPAGIRALVEQLISRYRPKYAIANSVETRIFIPAFEDAGVPVIALVHEFAEYTRPAGTLNQLYSTASVVVFSANVVAKSSIAEYPVLALRDVVVIPQGECEIPPPAIDEFQCIGGGSAQRRLVKKNDDTFLVIGVGRVQIRKGVELFLSIASLVGRMEHQKKIAFLWLGDGYLPDSDVAYSVYLRDQINRSDLRDFVEILDAVADPEPIYASADLFLLTSRLDPLPNVTIEAAMRALPVVCFDRASGFAELLAQNETTRDLVVPYLDCDAAARLVNELAEDPVRLRRLSDEIERFAKSTFDMDRYVDTIDHLAAKTLLRNRSIERDAALIVENRAFNPQLFLGDASPALSYEAAVRKYLHRSKLLSRWNQANAGLMLRRPLDGFHPFVYAAESRGFDEQSGEDPLAHFVKTGRPDGRWAHLVIRLGDRDRKPGGTTNLRAAIHGHFHYPELLDGFLHSLMPNRTRCDLYLTTNRDADARLLQRTLDKFGMSSAAIRVVPNRGRDIGPLLSELSDDLRQYDVIGHVHGKRSLLNPGLGDGWRDFLWHHLIGPFFPMVDTILDALASDSTLGLVFPEDPHLSDWNENRPIAEDLARRIGIIGALPTHFDFPNGTMFWARPAALQPLFSLGLRWEDYPAEPLAYDGTILHALERLLPFAAAKAGFRYATTFVPGSTR